MGFFNIIETSFFVSLAITFILVFLLMYFFKQKLNTFETKYDAVLTIVGNVVKEVNILRQAIMHTSVLHNMNTPSSIVVNTVPLQHNQTRPLHTIEELDSVSVSASETESEYETDNEDAEYQEQNVHLVSSERCNINTPCEFSDSDEDYSPSNTDSESDDDFIAGDEEEIEFDNSPIEFDNDTNISPALDIVNDTKEQSVDIPVSVADIEIELEPETHDEVPLYSGPNEILDITYEADANEDVAEKTLTEEPEDKESYKKMNIHQLKALVVTKGLVSDASKMKKNDIIRILEGTI